MEEFKSSGLFDYEPTDVSGIKPARIASEKDFEKEARDICELLSDSSKINV